MNYLAHSYLSFNDAQLVGNMIADFIKNNERENFSTPIQQGIQIHRFIDSFTDAHPAVLEAKKAFRPLVRLYSGAFVDVSFDYFLANSLPADMLKKHSEKVYRVLRNHEEILPANFLRMLDRMEKDDWLYHYKDDWGIKFSMQNVLNKAKYLDKDLPVFAQFLDQKKALQQRFDAFFPELLKYAEKVNAEF